jgi:diacylglycerol kinase family enzyme
MDREAIAALGPLSMLYRDHAVYAGAFVKTFLESYLEDDKFSCLGAIEGKAIAYRGLTDLVIKATRVFGGSWVLEPEGTHDDGLFEFCPFVGKRDWASKALVALDGNPVRESLLNEVGIEHSKNISGSTFTLHIAPGGAVPVYAQIDGEEYVQAPRYEVSVLPRALRLVVPG